MTALAEYLLKANLCLIGFYALYHLLLRRHTFFRLNRAYLLAAMCLSFALPFISLPEPVVETVSLPISISLPATVVAAQPDGPTLSDVLPVIYGVGAGLFLTLLLVSLARLWQLIRSGTATRQSDHTLVVLSDARVGPFSFFRYLVLNQTDFNQHPDPIIRHELAHIRQWHSVDVLLAELVKVLCWPNPVAWLYKRSLQQVHEYLADQEAADKAQYARFLFDYAFEGTANPVANSFFRPFLLARRVRMLHQTRNTNRILWKYGLIIPLLLVLVGLTTACDRLTQLLTDEPVGSLTVSGQVLDSGQTPVEGVQVFVQSPTGEFKTDWRGHIERTDAQIETDHNGRYTLTGVSPDAKVEFIHPKYIVTVSPVKTLQTNRQTYLISELDIRQMRNGTYKGKLPLRSPAGKPAMPYLPLRGC